MTSESETAGFFAVLVERLFGPRPEPPKVEVRPTSVGVLYPTSFAQFIGQPSAVMLLKMEVESAKRSRRPLSHLLFHGSPGVGKTALAHVLAGEMGAELYESAGPEFPDQISVFKALDTMVEWHRSRRKAIVWLVDEIDGMAKVSTYATHGLLTHGYCIWQSNQLYEGLPISLIGTTNYLSAVPGALKSRFSEIIRIRYYPPAELAVLATQSADRMGFGLTEDAALYLGSNAAGEPRRINIRLLRVVRNLLLRAGKDGADLAVAREALKVSSLKPGGLNEAQFEYLSFLEGHPRRKASLGTVAAFLQLGAKDILLEVEPYLLHSRFVVIAPGGRELAQTGLAYLEEARKEMATWWDC